MSKQKFEKKKTVVILFSVNTIFSVGILKDKLSEQGDDNLISRRIVKEEYLVIILG